MQLKTILNRIEHFKSFVYGEARMIETDGELTIEVTIDARANGRPICSGCQQVRPGYDRLPVRRFEYVPLWGIAGVFSVRDAAGRLPDVRRDGRTSSLGRRQVPSDDELPLVPGPLGQAAVVEGSGLRVSHHLGQRVSCGKTRGFLGPGASRLERHRGHRRR